MKFLLFFLLMSFQGFAQTLEFNFPKFASKTYDFIIFQGSELVKIKENDTVPLSGLVKIVIPEKYAPYTGMCRWDIINTADAGGLNMALPGYGFKVSCFSAQPNATNIQWEGYDAINELSRLFQAQQVFIDKFDAMSRAVSLYEADHPLHAIFEQEQVAQQEAYLQFRQHLRQDTSYSARFLPIANLMRGISPSLINDYDEKANLINRYITNELDFNHLYTSGHWADILQIWILVHVQVLQDKSRFGNDFNIISQRIGETKVYIDFIETVTQYLIQYGKDDFIAEIAPAVVHYGDIAVYKDKAILQVYYKAMVGYQAPDLVLTHDVGKEAVEYQTTVIKSSDLAKGDYRYSLLLFYQSTCGACEHLIQDMIGQYEKLKLQGIRLISISSDTDLKVFENSSSNCPWPDKYCDFEGKSGVNFRNYAVIGTPTLILLDKQGRVLLKSATLEQVVSFLSENIKPVKQAE
jgi:thiol-disulfide isomerase/thioredoxin